jgi:AcrR family transcriptional regulator
MTVSDQALSSRPKRADARRNYEKVLNAARDAFAEQGTHASLEDIARRAGVGIGTLYRHFPSRQDLLEAVYVDEVEALCQSADDFAGLPPWEALVSWLNRFVSYVATKRALAEELVATVGTEPDVFKKCHDAIYTAGGPLLQRAQEAHAVRPDAAFGDVIRLVSGVTMIKGAKPDDIERILAIALDGLRYTPSTG